MNAAMVGSVIGLALGSLLLPVLILIVARFVGPMKRNPGVVYSVCAALALLLCFLGASTSGSWGASSAASVLALLFLLWGYSRERNAAKGRGEAAG